MSMLSGWRWFVAPWVLLARYVARFLESRSTLQITKRVMRRTEKVTAPMINPSFHFSSHSTFLTGMFTVKEKMPNCLMSVLCDAGVAVTLTCVTVPGEASCWEVRISRKGVVWLDSRETEDGWTLPVIEDWLESTWGKLQNRKFNGYFHKLLNFS